MSQSPTPLDPAADPGEAMFLTPRVIDRRTFEEYSTLLRALIREAAGEGRSLRDAAGQVREVQEGLERAAAELSARLDAVVRVMPTLEQRIARMEQLLGATTDAARLQDEALRHVGPVIKDAGDEAASSLRRRAAEIADEVLASLSRAARQIEEAARSGRAELASAQEQARVGIEGFVAEARREMESACAEARRRLADAARQEGIDPARLLERVREAEASLARRVAELEAGLGQAAARAHEHAMLEAARSRADLERAIAEAARGAEQLLADLDARLASVHEWASRVVAETESRLEAWSRNTARITASLGADTLRIVENLPGLIEEARRQRMELEEAIRGGADRIEGQSAALEQLAARHAELSAKIAATLAQASTGDVRQRRG